ncbi:MAG: hypothetical protein QOD40_1157 [Alphaproteobacteria bacterium]|jgi:hypothetical protein|nr:hypothetical protein [Alphaproteobacteria bacterium]
MKTAALALFVLAGSIPVASAQEIILDPGDGNGSPQEFVTDPGDGSGASEHQRPSVPFPKELLPKTPPPRIELYTRDERVREQRTTRPGRGTGQ